MAGTPYAAGGIRRTVAATRAATRRRAAPPPRRLRRRAARPGHHDVRGQDRLRAHRRTTRRGSPASPPRSRPRSRSSARTSCPAEYADRRDEYVDLVCGEMLDACAPHSRWIDVFCERGAFTADESRRILAAGIAHGLLAARARQSARPGRRRAGSRSRWARHPSITAPTSTTRTSPPSPARDTVATLLPGVEFSTRQPYPDARRLHRRGRDRRARERLQPRVELHELDAAHDRPRRARDGDDARRGGLGGDGRRSAGAAARRRRRRRAGHARRPRAARRADAARTWPTGPGVPLVRQVWKDGVG